MQDREKDKRRRRGLLYSSKKQLEKSRMSKNAPRTKGLDCSGTSRTLKFDTDVPKGLV
jgi:hypothetical protein